MLGRVLSDVFGSLLRRAPAEADANPLARYFFGNRGRSPVVVEKKPMEPPQRSTTGTASF
jgi:hypothetical protein